MNVELMHKSKRNVGSIVKMHLIGALLILLVSIAGIFIGIKNYLLFHTLVELTTVIIAFSTFIIAFNTYDIAKKSYFNFVGIAYGFVGALDFLHAISYKGIGIFGMDTANLATQFWIIARYIESISLFISLVLIKKHVNVKKVMTFCSITSALLILSIYPVGIFPDCFIEGYGLTSFKIISEYIIIAFLMGTAYLLYIRRRVIDYRLFKWMMGTIITTALSEIFFIFYSDVYSISNMFGHILKLISFYYVYRILINTGVTEPYKLLYTKLDRTNKELRNRDDELQSISEQLSIKEAERLDIEKLLIRSEEYYKMFIELSDYAILAHSDEKIVFSNSNCVKLLGSESEEELKGESVYKFIHPGYHKLIRGRVENILLNNATVTPAEFKFIRKDGGEIFVESTATSFIYNGMPSVISIIKDVSHRKKLNEAMEHDRVKTQVFADLSHELKTPINVFFASLQLLELYCKNGKVKADDEKVKRNIKTMKQNCYRLIRIVNNLVDITKIGSGYFQLKIHNHNIVSIVEEITLSVSEYVENKGIEFIFDTEMEEKILACDPDKIERVILNLISNAVKFTNPGGRIEVNIYDRGDNVEISVKDTGIGIPEDKLELIFERFKQVESSLARNRQGSGIGLSLVKSLIELHGGRIWVKSQEGRGSEFVFEVPVKVLEEPYSIIENDINQNDNIEKINIEFSDIYV